MRDEQVFEGLDILRKEISRWARDKKSLVSLSSYINEMKKWSKMSGVGRVSKLLEIGSGSGWFILTAVASGFAGSGVGVDPAIANHGTNISEIKFTESIVRSMGLSDRINLLPITLEEFLRNNKLCEESQFDLIVFRNSLHHIYPRSTDWRMEIRIREKCVKDLQSIRGLLKDGAYLYMLEASRPSRLHGFVYNLQRMARGAPTICWSTKRTLDEWRWIIEKAGFSVIGIDWLLTSVRLLDFVPYGDRIARAMACQFLLAGRLMET